MPIETHLRNNLVAIRKVRTIEYGHTEHGSSIAFPSQRAFHDAGEQFKGFSGPIGSGKSRALCHEALQLAYINRGCIGVIGAPTYPMLGYSTLLAFKEILAENHVPHNFNKNEYSVYFPEPDSTVLFRSLDSFEHIRGTNLGWFGVDELTYCREEAWLRLQGRLRSPKARELRGFAVWTPKGFDWVYKRFIGPDKVKGYRAILAEPGENTALPADFYASLKQSYDPRFYEQEVLGHYLSLFSGMAYFGFDRSQNVQPVSYTPGVPVCWALDFNVNPMCSVIGQMLDVANRVDVLSGRRNVVLHVLDEIALPDADINAACAAFVKKTEAWRNQWGPLPVYLYGDPAGNARSHAGPSDWQVVFEYFRNDGRFQFVKKVANSHPGVKDRVNAVNAMMANARLERRLFVDPGCRTLIQDLEQVTWKADANKNITGELDKKNPKLTHSSDALGYWISYECPMREAGGPRSGYIA